MATIYLDECGHTGENLLDKQQPFFVLASHNFSEEQCEEMKRRFFAGVKARTLKHSSLGKIDSYQQMVVAFLEELKQHQDNFKVSITDKKYALVGKIVDLIIEPFAHEMGLDLYDQGANIATANLFYYTMPLFGGEKFFSELLNLFQDMIRERTPDTFNAFFGFVFESQVSPQLEQELGMLRSANQVLGEHLITTLSSHPLDIALSQAMVLMSSWREEIDEPITLIHDASTNMSKQKGIWDALMSPDLPPMLVGYDRRKWSFPIGVSETRFERDETYCGLQIADVIAGAFARACRWQHLDQDPRDPYGRALMEVVVGMPDTSIIPHLPSPDVTPDELGTVGDNAADPNIHIAKIIQAVKESDAQ